jgi:hypothetical protein
MSYDSQKYPMQLETAKQDFYKVWVEWGNRHPEILTEDRINILVLLTGTLSDSLCERIHGIEKGQAQGRNPEPDPNQDADSEGIFR